MPSSKVTAKEGNNDTRQKKRRKREVKDESRKKMMGDEEKRGIGRGSGTELLIRVNLCALAFCVLLYVQLNFS